MKRPIFSLLICVMFATTLALPAIAQENVPPLPTIRLDAGQQSAIENPDSFCWPIAPGDNQCDFDQQRQPEQVLSVSPDQTLEIVIFGSLAPPSALSATLIPQTGQTQMFNLQPALNAVLDEPLPVGRVIIEVLAQYDDVAGVEAFVSYRFGLEVFEPAPTPDAGAGGGLPVPTEEAMATDEATAEATALVTAEATEEVAMASPEATEAPTEPPTATATQAVITAEPTQEPLPPVQTPEAIEEATQESALSAATEEKTPEPSTPESITPEATAEATSEAVTPEPSPETATPEATPEATEEATPEATEEITLEPMTPQATAEADAMAPTATTVPRPGETQAVTPETEVASAPTATTVPRPQQAAPAQTEEVVQAASPIPTTMPTLSVSTPTGPQAGPTATPTPTLAQGAPDAPPEVRLVFAGQRYAPAGVSFCQRQADGSRVCVDNPIPRDERDIRLLNDFAAQLQFGQLPRPGGIELAYLNADTLAVAQRISRPGDRVVLFNVDVAPGDYILRVTVDWGDTDAEYFFRVVVE